MATSDSLYLWFIEITVEILFLGRVFKLLQLIIVLYIHFSCQNKIPFVFCSSVPNVRLAVCLTLRRHSMNGFNL